MRNSLTAGRFYGAPIDLHWTFLFVLAWVLWAARPGGAGDWDWASALTRGIIVFIVFACVLLHEMGHALVARRFGIGTKRILLFPLGGGAFLEEMPERPRHEILVALGGPAVNLLLAGLAAPFIFLTPAFERRALLAYVVDPGANVTLYSTGPLDYVVVLLFLLNLMLAVFNLLPAYPLDGGRVLRAALSWRMGRRRATFVAAVLGVIAALGFLYLAYVLGDWLLGVGGLMVGVFAGFELVVNRRERILSARRVAELARPADAERLYLNTLLSTARTYWRGVPGRDNFLVYNEWNDVAGVLEHSFLADEDLPGHLPLRDVVDPRTVSVLDEDTLMSVALLAQGSRQEAFAVYTPKRQLVGIIEAEKIFDLVRGPGARFARWVRGR